MPDVTLGYETWGTLNPDGSNAVLIEHALTGDTHVTRGAGEEPGWWEQLAGPGAPVDTDKYFVVSINILGGCYGSTGPSTPAPDGRPWGSRFPLVTLRDTTAAEARLADALGIRSWYAVLGGSLGGARALEWAVSYPDRVRRCGVFSVGASSTAEQIAFAQAQTLAIRQDPNFNGGDYYGGPQPEAGLALARRIAHITYRSAAELDGRFGRNAQDSEAPLEAGPLAGRGRYQVESYLDHQGNKLVRRFDANSYIAITEALMSHDISRGRGALAEALAPATAEFLRGGRRLGPAVLPGPVPRARRRPAGRGCRAHHRGADRARRLPDRDRPAQQPAPAVLLRLGGLCCCLAVSWPTCQIPDQNVDCEDARGMSARSGHKLPRTALELGSGRK